MKQLPSETKMYAALVARDSSFDGVFVVGVKTTRIFCRPTCPARKPARKNVEFFAESREALHAGYRACKRCHPLQTCPGPPAQLKRLVAEIDRSPTLRLREQDLRDRGFDPSTVRRQFQKHFGMTFHAYQRARRMGNALGELRGGRSVIDQQQASGFQSASGFWQSFRKTFGESPRASDQVRTLMIDWIETPLGGMVAIADDSGLHLLEFVDRPALENEIRTICSRLRASIVPTPHPMLQQIRDELDRYFLDGKGEFETPVVMGGTAFERDVWNSLLKIPAGSTLSYQTMAEQVGRPNAVRAVGRANGKNCLAIIVPCHRVIGADGKLTGYGGGLWRKQRLLELEGVMIEA